MFHSSFHPARTEFEMHTTYSFAPRMDFGLAEIATRGFFSATIVDIGAFEGDWSRLAKRIGPRSRLFMIEPNAQKKPLLVGVAKELDARLLCDLLGAEVDQEVQFNLMGSGSSIMSERSPCNGGSRHADCANLILCW